MSQILLMGKSKSGKTSMKSIIFSELSAEETKHLATTSINITLFNDHIKVTIVYYYFFS